MSDDAPAFINAWRATMSDPPHKLLCTWHVDRNWEKKNLNKIKSKKGDGSSDNLNGCRVLLENTNNVDDLPKLLEIVLNWCMADEETADFGN